MPGKIVDLGEPMVTPPNLVAVDANVVVTRLVDAYPTPADRDARRAAGSFRQLEATGHQGILTPTAYSEVIHAAVKVTYQRERATHRAALAAHYNRSGGFSWVDLYKLDPTILYDLGPLLEQLRQRLIAANLVLLDPQELGPIPSGRRYDQELLALVGRYGLDTSDATILMEASRVGIAAIVTMDRDLRRAVADFDVYTWL